MKKIDFDKNYIQIAVLVLIVIIISITFYTTIGNIGDVFTQIASSITFITGLLFPFFIGFCIAYVLNPAIRTLEKSRLKNIKFFQAKNNLRSFTVFITYLCAFVLIYMMIYMILPSVVESIAKLTRSLPSNPNYLKFQHQLNALSSGKNNFVITITNFVNQISGQSYTPEELVGNLKQPLTAFASNLPELIKKLFQGTVSFAGMIISIILGIVISIYYLLDKEYFVLNAKKYLYTLTKKKVATRIMQIASLSSNTLEKFIVGKAIDSFIIGMLFFIVCLAFNVQYASLFALIIGVTNMIPYFGPFFGAIPVLLITCIYDFKMVIPMGISILVLQQFDGIILGPKILGDSIGLKPISIILAITIGGGLFGVPGMFLGAPIYAVIATILNEIINKAYNNTNTD